MHSFNVTGFAEYLVNPYLLGGAVATLWLTASAIVIGFALGFALELMRRSRIAGLAWIARAYVWLFRGTPLLVQLIVIYTGLPQFGVRIGVVESAVLGLSLNEAAYLAEIIRAGFLAVSQGQVNAGKALGMTDSQVLRYVVAPQAVRVIVPSLGNSVNGLLKTSSMASVISMEELLRRTQELIQEKFLVMELFTVAALYYLAMTTAWSYVQSQIERRIARPYDRLAETGEQR